ncbi:required for respiratory growth protein 9, mitochondrial [Zygosaccharomyces rouxii]|nr:required for respiratory growth protein 9, mitochondrial [Zygosaccharomyces rouxii]
MAENRSKGAKNAIKVVHESSLTSKEQREKSKDDETPAWKIQKMAISKKLKGQRWNPSKRLSREEMEGLRLIKSQFPHLNASELGQQFKVSPEVVKRILSSKWRPTEDELGKLQDRWKQRGERIKQMFDSHQIQEKPLVVPKRIVINTLGSSPSVVATTRPSKNAKSNKRTKNKLHLLQQREHDHEHSE